VLSDIIEEWAYLPVPLDAARTGKLTYVSRAGDLVTLVQLSLSAGAQPVPIAGPAHSIEARQSPDGSHFLITVQATSEVASAVMAGSASDLTQLTTLAPQMLLGARDVFSDLHSTHAATWAPDSSRAALWMDDPAGRKLVIYEPGAEQEWLPLALPAVPERSDVAWSPNSKMLVVVARDDAEPGTTLTLVELPGYATRVLDFPIAGFGFGPEGQLVFGAEGESFLLNLQAGLAASGDPIDLPGEDEHCRFGTTSNGLICNNRQSLDSRCTYIDLSGPEPAPPVTIATGYIWDCDLQPMP
jgi:hypothetical protein